MKTITREIFQIFYNGVVLKGSKKKREREERTKENEPRAYPSIFRGNSLDACKSSDYLNSVMKGGKGTQKTACRAMTKRFRKMSKRNTLSACAF